MAVVAGVVSIATVGDDVSMATVVVTTVVWDGDVTADVRWALVVDEWSKVENNVLELEVTQPSSSSSAL